MGLRREQHRIPPEFTLFRQAALGPQPRIGVGSSGRGPWLQFRLPTRFVCAKARLPIAGLPPALDGLRILHLSDLHLRNYWGAAYDQIIERIRADAPDLIL